VCVCVCVCVCECVCVCVCSLKWSARRRCFSHFSSFPFRFYYLFTPSSQTVHELCAQADLLLALFSRFDLSSDGTRVVATMVCCSLG
jgi:hypothetical protein